MSEMRTMENESLRVTVSDHGAELLGIYDKRAEKEVVWQGDPAYWNRHAPVLFPFVGKVTGGYYRHEGVSYPMGQHGFARDREFVCVEAAADHITHRLVSDAESRKVYPFDFELEITHALKGNQVEVIWRVKNPSTETLYFSIGGHPAFQVPDFADYRLSFPGKESLEYVLIDPATAGVDTEHVETLNLEQGYFAFDAHTFEKDALIFDGGQVKEVGICYADGSPYVTMRCPDALSVGIWSPPGKHAPFVCLEPWIGRCDNSGFQGELKEKYDVQALDAGAVFETAYTLVIG